MKIVEYLQQYCEAKKFRMTVRDNKLHLVYVVDDAVRTAEFDDVCEMLHFVDIRA